jgi:hypothetical protein
MPLTQAPLAQSIFVPQGLPTTWPVQPVKVALKVSNNVFCHVARTTNHITLCVEHFESAKAVQAIIIITQFTIIHLILGCFTNAMNTGPTGTNHICSTRIANHLACTASKSCPEN